VYNYDQGKRPRQRVTKVLIAGTWSISQGGLVIAMAPSKLIDIDTDIEVPYLKYDAGVMVT
jgi:hypothetical protein